MANFFWQYRLAASSLIYFQMLSQKMNDELTSGAVHQGFYNKISVETEIRCSRHEILSIFFLFIKLLKLRKRGLNVNLILL